MPIYQVHYTNAGDRKTRTIDRNDEPDEADIQQVLVELLNLGRQGATSYAEVLQRNHIHVDHWERIE